MADSGAIISYLAILMASILAAMNTSQLVALLLSSAAIGAVVSSIITLVGQRFERRSRRHEMILSKAVELAELQVQLFKDYSSATGQTAKIYPYPVYIKVFQQELEMLLDKRVLTPDFEEKYDSLLHGRETAKMSDVLEPKKNPFH